MLNTQLIQEHLEKLAYSHEGSDSRATVLYNEIAADLYPDKSFQKLVEMIKKSNPKLAQLVGKYGIDFKLLAKGDSYTQSGWEETSMVGCCTESWYHSDREVLDLWQKIEQLEEVEEKAEEVREALSEFESNIANEVIEECKKRYGEFPTSEEINELYDEECDDLEY